MVVRALGGEGGEGAGRVGVVTGKMASMAQQLRKLYSSTADTVCPLTGHHLPLDHTHTHTHTKSRCTHPPAHRDRAHLGHTLHPLVYHAPSDQLPVRSPAVFHLSFLLLLVTRGMLDLLCVCACVCMFTCVYVCMCVCVYVHVFVINKTGYCDE